MSDMTPQEGNHSEKRESGGSPTRPSRYGIVLPLPFLLPIALPNEGESEYSLSVSGLIRLGKEATESGNGILEVSHDLAFITFKNLLLVLRSGCQFFAHSH